MGNKYYRRSANRERDIVNEFRAQGCIALRSAGSHSPVDVVVIDPALKRVTLIQVKITGKPMSKNARAKLFREATQWTGNGYSLNYELWENDEKHSIQ